MMQTGDRILLAAVILAACLVAQLSSAQGVPPAELKALTEKYEQGLAGIQTNNGKAMQDWPPAYVGELKKIEQKLRASGDLDGLLAVRKEMERFGREKAIPENAVVTYPVLRELQLKWRKVPETLEIDASKQIVLLSRSHIAALEDLKKGLTVRGKIDEAVAVKNEADRVRTSAPVTAAEFILANAGVTLTPEGAETKPPAGTPGEGVDAKPSAMAGSLRASLVLYYSFDKDEDGKVTDQTKNKNDAAVRGAKWTSKGQKGGAYRFKGGNDIIYSAHSVTVSRDSDYTICAWFKKSGGGSMGIVRIGTESGDGVDRNVIVLTLDASPLVARVDVSQVDSRPTPGFPIEDEVWYHAALVYSKSKVSLYANGKLVGSVNNDMHGGIPGKAGVTRIGGHYAYVSECPFIGLIDEVMIFNRALSKEEIKRIYEAGK